MKKISMLAVALTAALGTADAQVVTRSPGGVFSFATRDDPNAARIGVYLGTSGLRDTLGVHVTSVVEGGPAAAAGIKVDDRIVSVDGVNLRMTRMDAEDSMLGGMMTRRLTRTLDDKSPGDEVELRVWSDGSTRTVRVKTVASRDLDRTRERAVASTLRSAIGGDRAVLGLTLGGSVSKRDTLGVLVVGITPEGPAEKAGLIEGDRIARINDVDVRVPREDAGDPYLSQARLSRLSREIGRLDVGDQVTLTVVSGGRSRQVQLTPVRAGDLPNSSSLYMYQVPDGAFGFSFPGAVIRGRNAPRVEIPRVEIPRIEMPRIEIPRITIPDVRVIPNGRIYYYNGIRAGDELDVRGEVRRALEAARRARDLRIGE